MSLVIDTVPSGAEARIRDGASCYTPCELTVSPMGPFMVDLILDLAARDIDRVAWTFEAMRIKQTYALKRRTT